MNLFEELLSTLPEGRVVDLRVGLFWTGVVSQVGHRIQCGLASTVLPSEYVHGEDFVEKAGLFVGERSNDLAALIYEERDLSRSIALAALNSLLPQNFHTLDQRNADEIIAAVGRGRKVVMVGHFAFTDTLREKIPQLQVLELRPRLGDLPADRAADVLPLAEVVAITSMALINGTYEGLLALVRKGAMVLFLGPSTPLSSVLFKHGVDILSGCIVENIPAVLEVISQGGTFHQVRRAGVKLVNLYSERVAPFLN